MTVRRRRGPGEGLIRRRGDGRWEGRITTGRDSEGKQTTRAVFGRTRAEVVTKLDGVKAKVTAGLPVPPERLKVDAYLKSWLDAVEIASREKGSRAGPRTAAWYRMIAERYLIPDLGEIKLRDLQPSDVERMLAQMQAAGLSPRTASHCRAVLRRALRTAEKEGKVARNVASLADPVKVPDPYPTVLTPEQAREVVAALTDPGLRRLATVALGTGLRQGEQLGLRWQDVDLQRGKLSVKSALTTVDGEYQLKAPKTNKSCRDLAVVAHVVKALAEEKRAQVEARLRAGSRWHQPIPDLVFTTANGAPRNGTSLTHLFQEALQRAGRPRLTWHALRAAYGALLLQGGVDISVVSNQLGHSAIGVTVRHYAGVAESLGRDASDRLERLLSETS